MALARRRSYAIARWRELNWRSRARLDLSGAALSGAKLPGVDLSHDDLSGVDLTSADLHGANLTGAKLESAYLSRSNLSWSNLREAHLRGVSLVRANLKGSNLQGVDLGAADLSWADLSMADLTGANLSEADLTGSVLAQADLTGASLCRATMTSTDLDIANLDRVDLRLASLVHASLDGTLLSSVRLEMTLFGDCDMSRVLGLESARHDGPSIIGLDTLLRSRGMLPGPFLLGAGVPAALMEIHARAGLATSGCSHILLMGSVKDAPFIKRLEQDLRAFGLACWRLLVDDEEALLHDGAFPPVQRLAYYDQKLLVCSQSSLESPYGWRFFEQVASSRSRPGAQGKGIIPLTLDRSLAAKPGRLCDDLRSRPDVDFTRWEQDGVYEEQLKKLVAMLKYGEGPARPDEPLSPVGN